MSRSGAARRRHEYVELLNEFGIEVPLWDQAGWLGNDRRAVARGLGISDALLAEICAWQAYWQSESGWTWEFGGSDQDQQHQARGEHLRQRLAADIQPSVPVRLYTPSLQRLLTRRSKRRWVGRVGR